MAKRILILFAVLVAGLLAVWLLRTGAVDYPPATERNAIDHEPFGVDEPSPELDLVNAFAPAAEREFAVQPAANEVSVQPAKTLTIEPTSGDDLRYFGRVLSREDKVPIAGATIEIIRVEQDFAQMVIGKPQSGSKQAPLAVHTTGSDGFFELSLFSPRNTELRTRAPGFGVVIVQSGRDHETRERAKVVYLTRSASLHARLLDSAGALMSDASVRVWTESYKLCVPDHGENFMPSTSVSEWRASASSNGLCVLQDLPPEVPFHVEIIRDGHVVKRDLPLVSLNPGEVRELDWRIGAGCLLEGKAVDERGDAVRGRAIWLQRANFDAPVMFQKYHGAEIVGKTNTDVDGRFSFPDLSPGKWWVGPGAERDESDPADPDGIAPVAQLVEVMEGSLQQDVLLRVQRGLYIRGKVLDPAGVPAGATSVVGITEGATSMLSSRTESDGTFALGPMAAGRYSLVAYSSIGDSEPVKASAGESGVVLLLTAGGSLRGTVVDGSTGRGCAAALAIELHGSADQGTLIAESAEDGTFVIDGVTPGAYDLAATASGQRVGVLRGVAVQAGNETRDLVVRLAPGATLRLKNAAKIGFLGFRVKSDETIVAVGGIQAGMSRDTVVPAGHLVIECLSAGGAVTETKEIELAIGEEKALIFGNS